MKIKIAIIFLCMIFLVNAKAQKGNHAEYKAKVKIIVAEISALKKKYPHFKKFKKTERISFSTDTSFWASLHYENNLKKVEVYSTDTTIKQARIMEVPAKTDGISFTIHFFKGFWTGQLMTQKTYNLGNINAVFFLNTDSKNEEIIKDIENILQKYQN